MAAHQAPCPWDSPGKNAGVGCHFLLQCMKVKSEREVAQSYPTQLLATPWTAAYQAPPSMGFSRQEYWSGLPLPSPPLGLCLTESDWCPYKERDTRDAGLQKKWEDTVKIHPTPSQEQRPQKKSGVTTLCKSVLLTQSGLCYFNRSPGKPIHMHIKAVPSLISCSSNPSFLCVYK